MTLVSWLMTFLPPKGADSILIVAGMDATEDFNAIHSSKAKAMLKVCGAGTPTPSTI